MPSPKTIRIAVLLTLLVALAMYAFARENNGFDLSGSLVPAAQIHLGGPARDGIPSIDQPRFVQAAQATFMQPQDRVIGIDYLGIRKAYPIAILNWHEVVNDRFEDRPVAIT